MTNFSSSSTNSSVISSLSDAYKGVKKVVDVVKSIYSGIGTAETVLTFLGILKPSKSQMEKQIDEIHNKVNIMVEQLDKIHDRQLSQEITDTRSEILDKVNTLRRAADAALFRLENIKSEENREEETTPARMHVDFNDDAQDALGRFTTDKDLEDKYWTRSYVDEWIYKSAWTGNLEPPMLDLKRVWDYPFTLSAFIEALANFSIFILPFKYKSLDNYSSLLKESVEILYNKVYKRILAVFTKIEPPTREEMPHVLMALDDRNFWIVVQSARGPIKRYASPAIIQQTLNRYVPGGRWKISEYLCGFVEKYSAASSTMAYPLEELQAGSKLVNLVGGYNSQVSSDPTSPRTMKLIEIPDREKFDRFYDLFAYRHYVRSEYHRRLLAKKIGLLELGQTIEEYYEILDLKKPALQDFTSWSIRGLISRLPQYIQDTATANGGGLSMRKVLSQLEVKTPTPLLQGMLQIETDEG
ncbi:MAG: hypothetical protein AAGA60_13145 [Cyanobacteria bacterium P01_E01_bin.42]